MFYWLTTNIWTMVQQFIVIRNMPTPGSEAALAREARMARKNQRRPQPIADAGTGGVAGFTVVEEPKRPTTQRQQPVNKNRAKKGATKK
jgi:YidC/Oxa1 family membrane protein insertase